MAVDAASVASVDRSRRGAQTHGGGTVQPLAEGDCSAALRATVERLFLGSGGGLPPAARGDAPNRVERVVLVLLDAFGWGFFGRYGARHPLLPRVRASA